MPTAKKRAKQPRCLLIAGPNGSGKTTFAMEYLVRDARVINFVNADLVARGLSPLRPDFAAVAAGRLVLREIDRYIGSRMDFAFESTLSGMGYVKRLRKMKAAGYHIEIIYLQVSSSALALKRIAARVKQGGHDVARADVVRRFTRSRKNFEEIYKPLADGWAVYDNSGRRPKLLESGP